MNAGAEAGAIPAKVLVRVRPMVTAGLANEVEAVDQYAVPVHAPTAQATCWMRPVRTRATMTNSSPAVATASLSKIGAPPRW